MRTSEAIFITLTAACAATVFCATAVAATPNLTVGNWEITGSDTSGTIWSGSQITFVSQLASGIDYSVTGYFYWISSSGSSGRENFTGTLFANNHLTVHGFELVPPTTGSLVTNVTYNADVTLDGTRMINGTWGGNGIPSNAWTAVQVVPEPSQYLLLLAGIPLLLAGISRQRREA